MARMQWIGLSVLSFALTTAVGCVPTEKYNAARMALDAANEQLATRDRQTEAAKAEADAYQRQLRLLSDSAGNQGGLVTSLTTQLTDLQGQYADLDRRYQDALNRKGEVVVLAPEVNSALTDFATQNPDLVDFDSARGIVKFKSDLTFTVGSAELKPEARAAIGRFAQILNSRAAAGYELQVAGHTDSQPVSNPATKRAGHLDNWYLSSHRAITVGKELQGQRVSSARIAVVGYADQHPVASNASEQGRAQNRRVEVVILPSVVKAGVAQSPAAAPDSAGGPINKDTAAVEGGPAINK